MFYLANQGTSRSGPSTLTVATTVRMSKWLGDKFRLMSRVDSAKRRKVKRGQVYWCEFGENIGSEQCMRRPALILQNDKANLSSPNTIVAPITNTADTNPSVYPLHRPANSPVNGNVLLGNIVTISKARLGDYICELDQNNEIPGIEESLYNALGTIGKTKKNEQKLADKEKYLRKVKKQRNDAEDGLAAVREALELPKDAKPTTILAEIAKLKC